jgi:hypothetical protein
MEKFRAPFRARARAPQVLDKYGEPIVVEKGRYENGCSSGLLGECRSGLVAVHAPIFSAQPAVGRRSPRMFIFSDPLLMTIVPDGGLDEMLAETRACDGEAEPDRCAMLHAVFGEGDVVDRDFPESIATFY